MDAGAGAWPYPSAAGGRVVWSLLLEERAHEEIERLSRIIGDLKRMSFGARSEKVDPDQLVLALEDVEQELAAAEVRTATPEQKAARAVRRSVANRAPCRRTCPGWSR